MKILVVFIAFLTTSISAFGLQIPEIHGRVISDPGAPAIATVLSPGSSLRIDYDFAQDGPGGGLLGSFTAPLDANGNFALPAGSIADSLFRFGGELVSTATLVDGKTGRQTQVSGNLGLKPFVQIHYTPLVSPLVLNRCANSC